MLNSRPISFLQHSYQSVRLVENDKVAVAEYYQDPNGKPIIYLDQPMRHDRAITFTIEHSRQSSGANYSLEIGVTTCTKEKILNNFYHVHDSCKGSNECGSTSLTMKISKTDVKTVQITKGQLGDLIRIKLNNGIPFPMKDRSTGRKIEGKDFILFVILSGSARRIRVSDEPIYSPNEHHIDAELIQTVNAMAVSEFESYWKLSKGLRMVGDSIYRRADTTPLYAYYTIPFRVGYELPFEIYDIEPSWTGSVTVGMTCVNPKDVALECLPNDPNTLNTDRDYKRSWRAIVNPLSRVSLGSKFSIKRTASGVILGPEGWTIIPSTQLESTREWYLFLYFGGKVNKMSFKVPSEIYRASGLKLKSQLEPTSCLVCFDDPTTHMVFPCGHTILCDKCAKEKVTFCLKCNSEITRKAKLQFVN